MADDDQLTATLTGIREAAGNEDTASVLYGLERMARKSSEWEGWISDSGYETFVKVLADLGRLSESALRLLAAVDAVLKLPVEWRRESEALRDAAGKVWEDTPDAPGVRLKHAYAAGYAECAKALEAAITRELAGRESPGA